MFRMGGGSTFHMDLVTFRPILKMSHNLQLFPVNQFHVLEKYPCRLAKDTNSKYVIVV